jgi:hypothetical protein
VMWCIPGTTAQDVSATAAAYNKAPDDVSKAVVGASVKWIDKEGIKTEAASRLFYNVDDVKDRSGVIRSCTQKGTDASKLTGRYKLMTNAQQIHLVVAGGDHPSRSGIIPSWGALGNVEIRLPKNFDALLAQAEKDLGAAPITD